MNKGVVVVSNLLSILLSGIADKHFLFSRTDSVHEKYRCLWVFLSNKRGHIDSDLSFVCS